MFRFFPNNYMWSQGVLRALQSGGAIGEVITVVNALQDAADAYDKEAWYRAWHDLGDHLWQQGEIELAADHPRSARGSFLRACSYYQWSIAYMEHDDPRKGETHRRSLDAFARFAERCEPPIEHAEIPYEGTSFPAWFVPGAGNAARKPAIIYLPGLDSTKEQGLQFAQAMAERGFSVLLPDGPGVGEAVQFRGMPNRYDYEVPGKADFDYLAGRPDVGLGRRVGLGDGVGEPHRQRARQRAGAAQPRDARHGRGQHRGGDADRAGLAPGAGGGADPLPAARHARRAGRADPRRAGVQALRGGRLAPEGAEGLHGGGRWLGAQPERQPAARLRLHGRLAGGRGGARAAARGGDRGLGAQGMSGKTLRRGIVIGALLAALGACGAPGSPTASGGAAPAGGAPAGSASGGAAPAASAPAATARPAPQRLAIGVPDPSLAYLPAYVAWKLGYFEQ